MNKYIRDFKPELQAKSTSYIYISKSKNGAQYLDSFYGSTTNNSSKYVLADEFRVFLQENMFDSNFEKR